MTMSRLDDESTNDTTLSSLEFSSILGFAALLLSLICLGTWPALLRLSSTIRTRTNSHIHTNTTTNTTTTIPSLELIPFNSRPSKPRDTRFAYLDYALSYAVSSVVLLLCMWIFFHTPSEAVQNNDINTDTAILTQSLTSVKTNTMPWIFISFAMTGGVLLSLGNMSMQWATTTFGAPLTTVVAIQASLTVLLGTSINYWLEPERTTYPTALLGGVLTFWIAIALATRAHVLYGQDKESMQSPYPYTHCIQEENLDRLRSSNGSSSSINSDNESFAGIELGTTKRHSYGSTESSDTNKNNKKKKNNSNNRKHSEETFTTNQPDGLPVVGNIVSTVGKNTQEISSFSPMYLALASSIFGGCCFGFFSPAFNIAVNDPFQWIATDISTLPYSSMNITDSKTESIKESPLSVPMANLWFSIAFTLASVIGTLPLLYRPPAAFKLVPSTLTAYCKESILQRRFAILAGLLCGFANFLQFIGGNLVGFATADLVQAYPLISTLWDVYLFQEFQNNHTRNHSIVQYYLGAMYAMYICGVFLLWISSSSM